MVEFLVSMNGKGSEDPNLLPALNLLKDAATLVSQTGRDIEAIPPERIKAARAWIVVGGDGTLHHAVNALLKVPAEARCPIWYLPYGTGNDFARTLGLDALEPMTLLQSALAEKGEVRKLAVGRCNDRYFLNMATGGLFAKITPDANAQLKNIAGRWSYFFSGLGKFLERATIHARTDGGEPERALGFFVGNAKYAGGGIQLTPDASPFEGSLEYLLVPDLPTGELLALGLELQKDAPDLAAYPVRRASVKKLSLDFDQATPINLDGEQVSVRRAEFSVVPEAISIFLPQIS